LTTPGSDANVARTRRHIGGTEAKAGWKILNIEPALGVDYVEECKDLSRFEDGPIEEIYASHVLEHLGYVKDLPRALAE
jgi:predicted SAM-dependent methyltransferase